MTTAAIEPITDPADPRIDDYRNVPDAKLLADRGLFMAEGRLVVHTLLAQSLFRARSLLVTPPALESVRDALAKVDPSPPVYVASQEVMDQIVGFHIHRGALAAADRGRPPALSEILGPRQGAPAPLVALEGLTNHDNVGGIFRNALAFGASGVLLSPRCCDPLYRKAIRVSMGAALRVPFARANDWPAALETLETAGYQLIGLTPEAPASELGTFLAGLDRTARVALIVGSEGPGLVPQTLERCHHRVRIVMSPQVDSINVATAAAIALHALAQHRALG